MKVWVVSNELSQDVPNGVLSVHTRKADACRKAVECMTAQGLKFNRRDLGSIVSFTDEDVEFGIEVRRFVVDEIPRKSAPDSAGKERHAD